MLTRRTFLVGSASVAFGSALKAPAIARTNNPIRLTPQLSEASFLEQPEKTTHVWAFDGTVPGPVIRAKKGEKVRIEVINQLPQPTSIHWHGIRIENSMDGVANLTQEPIPPGESFDYEFTTPDAGTFWYHPHNRTWEQMARGLYGALIVEGDAGTEDFDRDYPIVVDDWLLNDDGKLHEASLGSLRDWSHAGRLGNILTLNGKPYENLDVSPGERIRLRFINSANARIMRFGIEGHTPWLVALDGQPIVPTKIQEKGMLIAPAQRVDLVFDVKGQVGDRIAITETSGAEPLVAGYLNLVQGTKTIPERDLPTLIPNQIPEPKVEEAAHYELVMSGGAMRFLENAEFKGEEIDGRTLARTHRQLWAFNGLAGMSDTPLFSVKQGQSVVIKLVNDTAWPHAIHLHGHHFRLLAKGARSAEELSPIADLEKDSHRDTVLIQRDEIVEIALVADNPGKWMLHCHMLEHQASGMGTWFEVT